MSEVFESGWRDLLATGQMPPGAIHPVARSLTHLFRLLPGDPRCRLCHAPFEGSGSRVAAAIGIRPSSFSMHLCGRCELRARGTKTGARVEVASLFADIRGSTRLSQALGPERYWGLIDRFYTAATEVLVAAEAIIERLVGDEVVALFVPGLAGDRFARRAIDAAVEMQRRFGAYTDDPWLPVGIGIDAGEAFVGVVGTMGGMTELTSLGDVPNRTARLAGVAGAGEILATDEALRRAEWREPIETRAVTAKGFEQPVHVGLVDAPS